MTNCDKCGVELHLGQFPFCPHPMGANSAIGDDLPGGVLIEHGICNDDGSPKRYYTKSSMTKAAKAKGLHQGAFLHDSPPGRRWV